MKIILHILLYLLTFFAYLGAMGWAVDKVRSRVPQAMRWGKV